MIHGVEASPLDKVEDEGSLVDAVAVNDGDGLRSVREGERSGGGNEHGERARGARGRVATSWASRQRREAGGGQARGRARRPHAPHPSGERRETTGISQLGWAGSWAAQVSAQVLALSLSVI